MSPAPRRTVLHVDLDAFYASVEQRDDPSLVGRPVVVGGPPPRGVVAAASYEARRFGVRSAMATAIALQRCPKLVLVRPRMGHYAEISAAFFGILRECSPLVEGLSLDEAFLDVTGEERLLGDGPAIARRIKDRVRAELRLVASVGVAESKFVAKVASDLGKPDGLMVVPPAGAADFLAPLPIARLWGVGEVTEQSLGALGLRSIGDLVRAGQPVLSARLGAERAAHLLALSRGEDDRPVEPERSAVSLGAEETFDVDYHDAADLEPHLLGQADRACARARAHGMRARTITVKVKYADHDLVTRRTTLPRATADGRLVGRLACRLLREVPSIPRRGVRLTGVSLSGLEAREAPRQLLLDEKEAERGEALADALDRIQARFGGGAVRRAVHVGSGVTEEDE